MSIRLRLTLWYAGSILALFLVSGLLLHAALHRTLVEEFDRGLADTVTTVRNLFRFETIEYGATEATLSHIVGELSFTDRRIEFRREGDGGARFVTRAPGRYRPPELAPPVRVTEAMLDAEIAPDWRVRIVASAAPLNRSLRHIDRWLQLAMPLSALLAGALGWWLTGRTLRPVGRMAAAAERITPAEPGARLPIGDPRDELGRLGVRFNALLERLEGALEQERRFIAAAAHELRTPIARMIARAELTLASRPDAAADREALGLVADDLRRASSLVDELLQLARADAGERPRSLATGYLDDAVVDAVASWRALAETHGVALRLETVDETPARFDPALVERLVGVLVGNAIAYTPRGGRVAVRVRTDADAAVLEVEDDGIGIPPEELPRVFDRFFRGRGARRAAPAGSGLGLPIARWIVEQHGGTIELAAAPGGAGTLARVRLPAAPTAAAPAGTPASSR